MPMFERLVRRMERRAIEIASGKLDQVEKAVAAFPGIEMLRRGSDRHIRPRRAQAWLDEVRCAWLSGDPMSAGGALQTAMKAGWPPKPADRCPRRAAGARRLSLCGDRRGRGDWSHKSGEGREVLVAITLWDDQPVRLHELADAVEAAVEGTCR